MTLVASVKKFSKSSEARAAKVLVADQMIRPSVTIATDREPEPRSIKPTQSSLVLLDEKKLIRKL
jgi:hypothetical protein